MSRDFNTGENPWNGTRDITLFSPILLTMFMFKSTMREKADTQQPSFAANAVRTRGQPVHMVLA